jgi:type I restriction enzyme S subunit
MRVFNNSPLVLLDTPLIDEISVEFRITHQLLTEAFAAIDREYVTLESMIDPESSITYGIVKGGDYTPDAIPMLKVEDLRSDRTIDTADLFLVSPSIAAQYSRTSLKEGDILVSIKGTIGRIAEVPESLQGANISRDLALVRLKDPLWNPFVMAFLQSELGQLQMTLHSRGAAVKGINLFDLRAVKIPICSDYERDLVVDRYDRLLSIIYPVCAQTDKVRAGCRTITPLVDGAFSNLLPVEDSHSYKEERFFILCREEQRDRLDTAYYDPKITGAVKRIETSRLPFVKLREVMVEGSYGVLPPSDCYGQEGIRLIRASDLSPFGVDYKEGVWIPPEWIKKEKARIRTRDVLIGIKGACAFYDIYAVTDDPPVAIVNGSIFRFQCKPKYDAQFVALWLLSTPIQTLVYRERSNLGISYISLDILNNIPIPDITKDAQQVILDKYRNSLSRYSAKLEAARIPRTKLDQALSAVKSNVLALLNDEKYEYFSSQARRATKQLQLIEEMVV